MMLVVMMVVMLVMMMVQVVMIMVVDGDGRGCRRVCALAKDWIGQEASAPSK